jgi:hypothetical protein
MRKAQQRMNDGLAPTGKTVNLPKPEGRLAEAQASEAKGGDAKGDHGEKRIFGDA